MTVRQEYDYSKLLGKFREKGLTQQQVAKAIGISDVSLSAKLLNKVEFKQSEMRKILAVIGEPLSMLDVYFFTPKLVKSQVI